MQNVGILFYSSEEPEFGARNSFIKNLLFHKNKCENHHKSNQKNKYSKSIILFKTLGTQTTVKNSKMIDFRDLQQV